MSDAPNYEEYDCPKHGKTGTDYCPQCADETDETEPLTDADLARIERCLPDRDTFEIGGLGVSGEDQFGTEEVRRLIDEVRRLRTFLLTLQGGLVGPPAIKDPGQILSDVELAAVEAVVRAAIRWTDTGPKAKVMSSFDLLMADLRRLRGLTRRDEQA